MRYIVQTSKNSSIMISALENVGAKVIQKVNFESIRIAGFEVELPDGFDVERIKAAVGDVIGVFPVQKFHALYLPKTVSPAVNVTLDDIMADLGFPAIWKDAGFDGGAGSGQVVKIAVVDTGVDPLHNGEGPFLDADGKTSRIKAKADFMGGPPYHPHGTWVAEIIARRAMPDGSYRAGCYRAWLYAAQVLDPLGYGDTLSVIAGINWAVEQGVHLINMSLGGPHDDMINTAVQAAWDKGVMVVCASGNSGRFPPPCDGSINSPADAENAIAVGAVSIGKQNEDGKTYVQSWCSRGPRWNGTPAPWFLVAPGLNIIPGYGDPQNSGTSFASPCVSSALGAMIHKKLRYNSDLGPGGLRELLANTCRLLGYKDGYGQEQGYCIEGHGYVRADVAYAAVPGGGGGGPGRKGAPSQSEVGHVLVRPTPTGTEPTLLVVYADKGEVFSGDSVKVTARLRFDSDGAPLIARIVQLNFGVATMLVTTDANGEAAFTFTAPGVAEDTQVPFSALFAGD